jgi:hypothetical protein
MLPDLAEIEHLKLTGRSGVFCHISTFFDAVQTKAWLRRSKQDPGFMDGLRKLATATQSAEKSAFSLTDDLVLAEVAAALKAGALVYEQTFPKKTDNKGKGRDTGTASGPAGGGGGGGGGGAESASKTSKQSKSKKKPQRDAQGQTTPRRSSTDDPPLPPAPVGTVQFDAAPPPPPFEPPAQPPAMPGREASGQTH